jgi:hypothetical protein
MMEIYRPPPRWTFSASPRGRAARKASADREPGFGHRLGHHRFHLIVGCLQVVTGPLSCADIGTEMNHAFAADTVLPGAR